MFNVSDIIKTDLIKLFGQARVLHICHNPLGLKRKITVFSIVTPFHINVKYDEANWLKIVFAYKHFLKTLFHSRFQHSDFI